MAAAGIGCSTSVFSHSDPAPVELLLSGRHQAYQAVADGLLQGLTRTAAGRRLRVAQQQLPESEPSAEAALLVAVGARACERVLEQQAVPILCVFIPEGRFRTLAARKRADQLLGAIFIDQPIVRQLALARALLPNAKRVGLLAGAQLSQAEVALRRAALALGFRVNLEVSDGGKDVAPAIRALLQRAELIVAAFEPEVLSVSTARWLLQGAHHRRIPVIGYSAAYVEAGALAAIYSSPESIGEQTAGAVLAWARQRQRWRPPVSYPEQFELSINASVASALGIDAPSLEVLAERVDRLIGDSR
ncbi:ABC transporter substrate binding protein [Halochromatium roseum]|uniref:ABC transporter substrate binding protein n=1 Tax=Halochromatium roseum TaxID=391920 RepID=UPI001911C4C7